MRFAKWFPAALLVVAIAAALLAWQDSGSDKAQAMAASSPTAATQTNAAAQAETKPSIFPMPVDEVPLAEQVQALMATGDPEKAYHAYLLLARCEQFIRDGDRPTFDVELLKTKRPEYLPGYRGMNEQEKQHDTKLCSGMTGRLRLSKLESLAIAVKAGVMGAVAAFAQEGPFGDPSALKTRPDDPLVQEWKAVARAQLVSAVEAGTDISVLTYLAAENHNGSDLFEKNMLLACRYFMAQGLVDGEQYGAESMSAKWFAKDGEFMVAMAKEFSPAERAAELAAAQHIADNFREQRKHAGDKR
ncbi:hypothetical protein [Rugamonas sp. DEMB1]|uniref:hypothetical protein n=1 Tax=Rugamonas sp. DEMB1 TaxID=3039386 RepID=UPI002447931A|nr:hypothetical protein [Rugamonas sp. DEMB1]WGG51596.1 hypothetical protein QC826_04900 [Rugamonas sp. DEMB1]